METQDFNLTEEAILNLTPKKLLALQKEIKEEQLAKEQNKFQELRIKRLKAKIKKLEYSNKLLKASIELLNRDL